MTLNDKNGKAEVINQFTAHIGAVGGDKKRMIHSLCEALEKMYQGAVSIDKCGNIVWINDKYRSVLGIVEGQDVLGEDIEKIIPESRLKEVLKTSMPILLDIMRFNDEHLVVSRLPLFDSKGEVIGAIGFVLYGNMDYLKPLISKFERLSTLLSKAEAQLVAERQARFSVLNIIGEHSSMVELRELAQRVATRNCPVLILGETGTGKELLAHSIHALSDRASKPFVVVNMAAIPDALLESEFFGVAPGAFTGADRKDREGKLGLADGGTLFMDEVADMPINMQVKLLRALDEQTFEAVGSNKVRKVDIRIIAATSQNLEEKIERGEFRQDLYFRLNVIPIRIPPLRERVEDILPLSESILKLIAADMRTVVRELTGNSFARLMAYHWPGNVRELRNILERACFLTDDQVIDEQVFAKILQNTSGTKPTLTGSQATDKLGQLTELTLPERLSLVERKAIREALLESGGKKASAARKLGIARSTLYEKIEEYDLSNITT